jgi:solute carrier family 25 aspartate/glutamate transporter 12/13
VLEGTETRFEALIKMADVTKVKEVVKESLLGSELPTDVQLSAQSKATFDKNARKDEKSGELFMGEEEFINAIAPEGEDYVSYILRPLFAAID